MTRPDFENLLKRYLQGESTEDEKIRIQIWFDTIQTREAIAPSDMERKEIEENLLLKINEEINSTETQNDDRSPLAKRLNSYLIYFGIAASLMLAIFLVKNEWNTIANSISRHSYLFNTVEKQIITKKNSTDGSKQIILEDGNSVHLASGSSISYKAHFDSTKRVVALNGDGFFQVTKKANRPFYVLCRGTVTKVLGTSFWVNSDNNLKSVEVSVKSGKVSVFVNKSQKDMKTSDVESQDEVVYLTPNQRIVFLENEKKIKKTLVTKPLMLEIPEVFKMDFIYKETPLPSVINELGKSYGVQILLADAKLKNCSFTGDLKTMSFDEKFALICESLSAKYYIQGTNIILTGQGCK